MDSCLYDLAALQDAGSALHAVLLYFAIADHGAKTEPAAKRTWWKPDVRL